MPYIRPKPDLTVKAAASELGRKLGRPVSVSAVRAWIKQGLFPHASTGYSRPTWYIPQSDIDSFTPPRPAGRPKKESGE